MAFKKGWKTVGGIRQKGYHRESTEQPAELCRHFSSGTRPSLQPFQLFLLHDRHDSAADHIQRNEHGTNPVKPEGSFRAGKDQNCGKGNHDANVNRCFCAVQPGLYA